MSTRTLHRAFGYLISRHVFEAGEWPETSYIDETGAFNTHDSHNIWFTTQGGWTYTEVNTGVVNYFGPGTYIDVSWDPEKRMIHGTWRMRADANTVTYCLDVGHEIINKDLDLAAVKMLVMDAGETRIIPKDTKLFLCDGTLSINDVEYKGTRQIAFRAGDREVIALTNCYGYIIP